MSIASKRTEDDTLQIINSIVARRLQQSEPYHPEGYPLAKAEVSTFDKMVFSFSLTNMTVTKFNRDGYLQSLKLGFVDSLLLMPNRLMRSFVPWGLAMKSYPLWMRVPMALAISIGAPIWVVGKTALAVSASVFGLLDWEVKTIDVAGFAFSCMIHNAKKMRDQGFHFKNPDILAMPIHTSEVLGVTMMLSATSALKKLEEEHPELKEMAENHPEMQEIRERLGIDDDSPPS